MLCTFTNLSHLSRTPASIVEHADDIVVFRAQDDTGSFYALLVPTKKIGVVEDSRTLSELKSYFPAVSDHQIEAVWNTQSNWGACFDLLNSLRNNTDSKSCLVGDSSFFLDSIAWPTLDKSVSSQSFNSGRWVISEVQSLSYALEQLAVADSGADLGSWEILSHPTTPDSPSTAGDTAVAGAEATKTRGTVRSYREALLKSPPKDSSNNEAEGARKRLNSTTAHVWKPTIVVQSVKHEHKDKLYQHNLAALGLSANPVYEPDEDDDECGGGSYFQSNEFAKGSVSLTRARASTMLKPAALEKKMARMASRAALRPPVPGGGGDSDSD